MLTDLVNHSGALVLELDFRAQEEGKPHELLGLFQTMEASYKTASMNLPVWMQPLTDRRRKRMAGQIDAILGQLVREKFEAIQSDKADPQASKKLRSVIALILKQLDELTPDMVTIIVDQLKTFLFAGHDTVAVIMQWTFYELSRTPHALAAVRAEMDAILGSAASPAAVQEKLLSMGEEALSRMTYTSAVLKEILRLYAPASTVRKATEGAVLTLPDGTQLKADGMILFSNLTMIHKDPKVYGETAEVFVPERWLGNTDTSMAGTNDGGNSHGAAAQTHIPVMAWRPFERGPRNCIGQELANFELRVILAMAVRRFDFEKVGLGELEVDEKGSYVLGEDGRQFKAKSELYNVSDSIPGYLFLCGPSRSRRSSLRDHQQPRPATMSLTRRVPDYGADRKTCGHV